MESTWRDNHAPNPKGSQDPKGSRDPKGSPATLTRESAVPARLRSMLLRQREKLQDYLRLLEQQERSILEEDVLKLETHVQLERTILEEIHSLRRVIEPLQDLYRRQPDRGSDRNSGGGPMAGLEKSLRRLQEQVTDRNRSNCRLLEERMDVLRQRIQNLSRPRTTSSPFTRIGSPALVDISL